MRLKSYSPWPLLCVATIVLIGLGCSESSELDPASRVSTPTPRPTPTPAPIGVLSADAVRLETNSLIVVIAGTVDGPGSVYVEYWAERGPRYRSKNFETAAGAFEAYALRLRAATKYSYQVFATVPGGPGSAGPLGTFTTGPLPRILRRATFDVLEGQPTHDLTFMEFQQRGFYGLVAIDSTGAIVWYYRPDDRTLRPQAMAQKPNGNIVYNSHFEGASAGLFEITPLGETVHTLLDECPPNGPMHHEVFLIDDETVLYMSKSILKPGWGDPPAPQEADTIGIWHQETAQRQIVWDMADFISAEDRTAPGSDLTRPGNIMWGGCDRDEKVQDWSHGNSAVLAEDGSVVVSLRHLDQVVSLAPDFKSVQWRLGGPGSDFAFPDPNDKFYHQHTAVPLPGDRVLLFDNGNWRPRKQGGGYSRGLELQLDFETMTAKKVWEYRHDPDIFSICCSNTIRLENGNTLMVFGITRDPVCCRPFTIVEANGDGKAVWEVEHRSPGKSAQYRVYPADSIMGETRLSGQAGTTN